MGWPAGNTVYGYVSFRNYYFLSSSLFFSIFGWQLLPCFLGFAWLVVPLLFLWQGLSVCPWQAWHLLRRPSWPWLCRDPTRIKGLLHRAWLMYPFPFFHFLFFVSLNLKHVSHGLYVVGSCGCYFAVFWVFNYCVHLCLSIRASRVMQIWWGILWFISAVLLFVLFIWRTVGYKEPCRTGVGLVL